ncbi:hypothetical protein [Patulibacter sp. SYSU D01012]|uniref:hypothetical protein n=1 Tax=Patulibacter sp. SYSU D01012 TaxID=2817381 RepID=UPI001B3133F8|nr:hypothetical protein [Patulibacter sp. SYSU D01012]
MSRRPLALLAVLAVATSATGCGGGDPSAFASATDRTCREVAAAVTGLREGLVRRDGQSETGALASAVDRYAAAVDAAAARLGQADPPKDERAFRDDAVRQLRDHAATMRRATREARRGRVPAALARQLGRTGPAAMPEIPGSVLDGAPACRAAVR